MSDDRSQNRRMTMLRKASYSLGVICMVISSIRVPEIAVFFVGLFFWLYGHKHLDKLFDRRAKEQS